MYIRNHYLAPQYDEDFENEFQLEIQMKSEHESDSKTLKSFTLKELKELKS